VFQDSAQIVSNGCSKFVDQTKETARIANTERLGRQTDSLYIDLSEKTSTDSRETSEGVVLDYDASGNLIDIDNASHKVDLKRLVLSKLPGKIETATA